MAIRAASAPVSWGIMESVEPPPDYPFARVLDEIQRAGYRGTELGPYGFLPTDPAALQIELKARGLTLCSAFVDLNLGNRAAHKAGLEHVERTARLLHDAGCRLLILSDEMTPQRSAVAGRPAEAEKLSWKDAEWKAAGDVVREAVRSICRWGLRAAFHHHVGSHVETPREIDKFMAMFSPDELGLCLDTGHCAFGGGDPVALLERYTDRVLCVHLKDIDAARLEAARREHLDFHKAVTQGVFAPLGQGAVDFPRILALLREHEFDGWVVVEQDVLAGGRGADSPLANATAGRDFLRNLGV